MKQAVQSSWYEKKTIINADYRRLTQFITTNYGIKLPIEKKVMVEGRLQKRLKAHAFENFTEYIDFVLGEHGNAEKIEMINAISTNKTDFFREPAHFDYMNNTLLVNNGNHYKYQGLKIWSAASSSGEEIYTLAITLEEYMRGLGAHRFNYSILGTDISLEVLRKAEAGIYDHSRIENIPLPIRKRYFLKGKDEKANHVRVKASLRSRTKFGRLNLMDSDYMIEEQYDIIFCRNVLIYFDRPTQNDVVRKLSLQLRPGGYLFLGHSESLFGKNSGLKQIMPTIYQKTQ